MENREWTDKMITTHIAIIPSVVVCFYRLQELGIYMLFVLILSIWYHKSRERRVVYIECVFAHVLFVYGCCQMVLLIQPGNDLIFIAEFLCALATVGTYCIIARASPRGSLSYEKWHWILHIICAIWVWLLGFYHKPLFIKLNE